MNRPEALKLISKANKRSHPGFFSKIMGTSDEWLHAANEIYITAINLLVMDRPQDYDLIISLYQRRINNLLKTSRPDDNRYEISCDYAEIAKFYEKLDRYDEAITHYQNAINYVRYVDTKHVKRHTLSIARLYQKSKSKYHKAIEYYGLAMEISEDHQGYADMAKLQCELGEYEAAMGNYVKAAEACSDTIKRWTGKEYYVNASLCGFCLNGLAFMSQFLEYQREIPSLAEHPLLVAVSKGLESNDVEHFRLLEYDRFDESQVKLLVAIRRKIEQQDELQ